MTKISPPSRFPFTIVGFDLDGTLVDTSEDLLRATNHALAMADIAPLTNAQIRTVIGGGARMMLQLGIAAAGAPPVPPARFEELLEALLAYYAAHLADHSQPFPGAVAALDALDALGVRTGIVTNKREDFARPLLEALGLAQRMGAIIGGDTMGPGRAKPAREPIDAMIAQCGGGPAAFVGDSHFDVGAARNAGIPVIACAFGFLMEPVEDLRADAVIAHFDELVPALARLG
jgi:phosphoglycolate phosphatase